MHHLFDQSRNVTVYSRDSVSIIVSVQSYLGFQVTDVMKRKVWVGQSETIVVLQLYQYLHGCRPTSGFQFQAVNIPDKCVERLFNSASLYV